MAQTFLTPTLVANEALYLLENTRVLSDLINTNYSKEFVKVGDTVNVRKPARLYGKQFVDEVTRQEVTESSIPVKIDRIADVSVEITSKELTLDIVDFGQQVLMPAVLGLNEKIDGEIASFLVGKSKKSISEDGTDAMKDVAAIGKHLDNKRGPLNDRHIVFCPDHKYRYATADNLSKAAYAGDNQALREAVLGKLYGADTYMSQNLPYSYADTPGTAKSYKAEATATAGTVKITSLDEATATVKEGDGFIYEGKVYRFAEDKTGTSNAIASIKLTPDSDEFPSPSGTAVDVVPLKPRISVGFHRDAITLATRPLEPAIGGAQTATAIGDKWSIRVTFDYDSDTKKNLISLDVAYGLKELHDDLIATIVPASA